MGCGVKLLCQLFRLPRFQKALKAVSGFQEEKNPPGCIPPQKMREEAVTYLPENDHPVLDRDLPRNSPCLSIYLKTEARKVLLPKELVKTAELILDPL